MNSNLSRKILEANLSGVDFSKPSEVASAQGQICGDERMSPSDNGSLNIVTSVAARLQLEEEAAKKGIDLDLEPDSDPERERKVYGYKY